MKKNPNMRLRAAGVAATSQRNVMEIVRRRLSDNRPYSFYFRDVKFDYDEGVLTLRGWLGSFYLKQVLQTLLRDIDGVTMIDNQVGVVSSTGLSSITEN